MAIQPGGWVSLDSRGKDMHECVLTECREMRKEMRRIEQLLNVLESQARRKTDFEAMRPTMSKLFWWNVSFMESFFAMTYAVVGHAKCKEVINDFAGRFTRNLMFSRSIPS